MAQRAPLHAPAHRGGYERHRPEETVLYRTLDAHWPAFIERAEEAGGLPRFVLREVEEYGSSSRSSVQTSRSRSPMSR